MDIAIAGAGIAGLSAAAFFGRAGHRVCVFDKAPAPAAVGSGLIVQPTGQAALAALGLLDDLKRRGARLDRLDGRLPGGRRKVLDVRYAALGPDVFGISVHRAALFELLLRAAREAGAAFHYGREVAGVADDGADMRVVFSNGAGSEPFDLVIDGLGVKSPLIERRNSFLDYGALWANAPFPSEYGFADNVLNQRYRGAGCSSGVMPIGTMREGGEKLAAFFWTLRADEYASWRSAPLSHWKEKVIALW
ncbi:MAG: FAD-dependent monooxygenase, partial [Parvularculaceae bacterium]